MKKINLLITLVVTLILVGAACSQTNNNSNGSVPTPPTDSKSTDTAGVTNPKTVDVNIADFAFSPSVITVKMGDTVRWTNQEKATHKVASNPHPTHTDLPGLVSTILNLGESYSYTFDKKGTWSYHCHLHPGMTGQIIVE